VHRAHERHALLGGRGVRAGDDGVGFCEPAEADEADAAGE
jgi:hypothetical protein